MFGRNWDINNSKPPHATPTRPRKVLRVIVIPIFKPVSDSEAGDSAFWQTDSVEPVSVEFTIQRSLANFSALFNLINQSEANNFAAGETGQFVIRADVSNHA